MGKECSDERRSILLNKIIIGYLCFVFATDEFHGGVVVRVVLVVVGVWVVVVGEVTVEPLTWVM